MRARDWPAAGPLTTDRLELEPLRVDHADELAAVLDDVRLHEFIGGRPATAPELRHRFAQQVAGSSPDGSAGWYNWVARQRRGGAALGTVQATVVDTPHGCCADLAWVVATGWQRQGYAREAAAAVVGWLRGNGVDRFTAHVHPEHAASAAVARSLGLLPTDTVVDGETRWAD